MLGHRMAAVDAQFYWMSAKVPNDEFLLYAFDGVPKELEHAIERVCGRASACPALAVRVEDGGALSYPRWVPAVVGSEHVVCHDLTDHSWRGCLAAVANLAEHQLDMRQLSWRLHLFAPVLGIPGVAGPGAVVVLQAPHALADGIRGAALAAWLFGRNAAVPQVAPVPAGFFPWRAIHAARTHRQLIGDTRAGVLAAGLGPRPLVSTNARPAGVRSVRTLVRHRAQLSNPTVTVAVLAAVSGALSALLGGAADSLGAEVSMAKPGVPLANNHFGNVTVGLYPGLDHDARVQRIAVDVVNGRRRLQHPAAQSADRAFAAVPAVLARWGVSLFDPNARPPQVAGNTVVSSVNRGAADLSFGDAPVVLTAGYPGLSPLMGLTHGVHGIGDTVAISVLATPSAVPDMDDYAQRLDAALNENY